MDAGRRLLRPAGPVVSDVGALLAAPGGAVVSVVSGGASPPLHDRNGGAACRCSAGGLCSSVS